MTYNLDAFNFSNYGASGFGNKDWDAAKGMGYNDAHMRILGSIANNRGLPIGVGAQQRLSGTAALPWNFAGYGGHGLGMQDINAMIGQGWTYNRMNDVRNFAQSNAITQGGAVADWFTQNKDNYNYFDAQQKMDHQQKQTLEAEKRQQEQYLKNLQIQKEMNPRTSSNNAQMQSGKAGGVAIKRSDAFRQLGGSRSTSQAGRNLLIESLNI